MIKASRPGLVALAFLGSAVLGGPLLLVWDLAVAYGSLLPFRHSHAGSGIGAAAGGVSKVALLLVPMLCGAIGALVAHSRLKG